MDWYGTETSVDIEPSEGVLHTYLAIVLGQVASQWVVRGDLGQRVLCWDMCALAWPYGEHTQV